MGIKVVGIVRKDSGEEVKKYQKRARKNRTFWINLSIFIILVRLTSIFLIFINPLLGFIAALITDSMDFVPLLKSGLSFRRYNQIDKPIDFFTYIVMSAYWFGSPLFNIFLLLLIIRFIGIAGFLYKLDRKFMVFFPNLIEPMFLGVILVQNYHLNLSLAIVALVILKITQEVSLYYSDNLHPKMYVLKINFGKIKTEMIMNSAL